MQLKSGSLHSYSVSETLEAVLQMQTLQIPFSDDDPLGEPTA